MNIDHPAIDLLT